MAFRVLTDGWDSERGAAVTRDLRIGLFIIVVMLGGAFTWMALAPIASSVIGEGVVKVEASRQVIQATTAGRVREILTADGRDVKAGEPLIVLHDARVSANQSILQSTLDSEQAKHARLEAEQRNAAAVVFPASLAQRRSDPTVRQFCQREEQLFATRKRNLNDQLQLLAQQKEESLAETERLDKQLAAEKSALQLVRAQVTDQRKLFSDKFISRSRLQDIERTEQEYQAKVHHLEAEQARLRQKINDFQLRAVGLQSGFMQNAAEELKETTRRLADLQEQLASSQDATKSMKLLAPMAGKVFNLKVHTVGELVQAGAVLAEVVPDQSDRIVESTIPVRDIKHVTIGSKARVRFTAYNARTTPEVDGKVIFIAADRTPSPDPRLEKQAGYLVRIRLDQDSLKKAGGLDVMPGMSVSTHIIADERTMLNYLLRPYFDAVSVAFRETY